VTTLPIEARQIIAKKAGEKLKKLKKESLAASKLSKNGFINKNTENATTGMVTIKIRSRSFFVKNLF